MTKKDPSVFKKEHTHNEKPRGGRFLTLVGVSLFCLGGFGRSEEVPQLKRPIKTEQVFYYQEGLTTSLIRTGSDGQTLSFCFTPFNKLYYGSTHERLPGAKKVEADSAMEKEILSHVQAYLDSQMSREKQQALAKTNKRARLSGNEIKIWHMIKAVEGYQERKRLTTIEQQKRKEIPQHQENF